MNKFKTIITNVEVLKVKRNKYNAIKTVVNSIVFDSKKEARRYSELLLLVRVGDISELILQPRFDLYVEGTSVGFYKADFQYLENNKVIVEDVKGVLTPVYRLKKKLVKAIYGIDILET